MLIKQIDKKDILSQVTKAVKSAKEEVVATMLLSEERISPLPHVYHELLKEKLVNGVKIKRLGFGTRGDYTIINNRLVMDSKNYHFRYVSSISEYQRLLVIDKKIFFFGLDELFFQSSYPPLIKAFLEFFDDSFKKGKT